MKWKCWGYHESRPKRADIGLMLRCSIWLMESEKGLKREKREGEREQYLEIGLYTRDNTGSHRVSLGTAVTERDVFSDAEVSGLKLGAV